MPEDTPKISICIPTYNRSDLLRKTLVSVSKQTAKPYEVMVIDNCSEDDTEAVVKSFRGILYYRNDYNLGVAGNWNRCIKLASGDFLNILHSDDLISPNWYEEWSKVISLFMHTGVGVFFLPGFTIDLNENTKIVYYSLPYSCLLKEGESIRKLWSINMCGLPASGGIIFRKSIFDEISMFDESYTTETDTLMAYRILNRYPVYYYRKLLYAYRVHPFQAFDIKREKKSQEKKYSVLINHLKIVKAFYNNELKEEYKQPFFYKRVIYMYLAIAVFYFLTLKPKIGREYYEHIRQVYPDLHFSIADYFMLISVIFHYIYKLIWGRILALPIKTMTKDWVK